jgi:hypothetical protein
MGGSAAGARRRREVGEEDDMWAPAVSEWERGEREMGRWVRLGQVLGWADGLLRISRKEKKRKEGNVGLVQKKDQLFGLKD